MPSTVQDEVCVEVPVPECQKVPREVCQEVPVEECEGDEEGIGSEQGSLAQVDVRKEERVSALHQLIAVEAYKLSSPCF